MSVPVIASIGTRAVRSRQRDFFPRLCGTWIVVMAGLTMGLISLASSTEPRASTQENDPVEIKPAGPQRSNHAAAEPRPQVAVQKVVEDIPTPPPIPRIIRSDAILGEPYGVAQLTIPLGNEPEWHADQPVVVREVNDRLLFPCYAVRPSEEGRELIVRFLFRGTDALVINVGASTGVFVEGHVASLDEGKAAHQALLGDWWTTYTGQLIEGPSEELSSLGHEIATILGRQLNLDVPAQISRSSKSSDLERQFERSLAMLFGFESVRLAMMKDPSPAIESDGPAVHPLPRPLQVRAVAIPHEAPAKAKIEPLASYVPQECFYLRCRSLENYLWLRGFIMGWGGNLDEMVATPVVDGRVRERLERQLGLDPSLALKLQLDESLDDFALVGGDTYFAEGAAVGVLMLANNPARVRSILDHMRNAVGKSGAAVQHTVMINGKEISLYETPDNTIRSFYVAKGNCHLVTNSRWLVERFLSCHQGGNLASLAEFRYARSKISSSLDLTSFLYLSDPFFRKTTSPATRIEVSRRRRAASELRQLNLARLIAAAEGLEVTSIEDLVQNQLLSPEFGKRADGSSPVWTFEGTLIDSLRGRMGTFLPIDDVEVNKATQMEVWAYAKFTQQYLREWQAMDPVLVALQRQPTADPHDERVNLEIMVTPYARNAYAFLSRHLAPVSNEFVQAPPDDVLTLTAQLQAEKRFGVCVGLRDATVPFRVENGRIVKEGVFQDRSFANWRSYAAVTPAGTSGLMLLGEFTKSLQSREIRSSKMLPESTPEPQPSHPVWLDVVHAAIHFPGEVRRRAFAWTLEALPHLNDVSMFLRTETAGEWTMLAQDRALRQELPRDLCTDQAAVPSQIQFHVRNVNESKVGPYLHAYSWETGRRISAENVAWLSRFMQTTKLELVTARNRIEQLAGGELSCPLGGKYELRGDGAKTQLVSTAWGTLSRYDETAVPVGYRLPFLAWLRELNLDFRLSPTTLTSHIQLHVDPTVVRGVIHEDGQLVEATPPIIEGFAAAEREQAYQELLIADHQLRRALTRLDPSGAWTAYLAVPPTAPQTDDDWQKLRSIAERFQMVATDRRYEVIKNVLGFTETHSQVNHCLQTQKFKTAR